MQSETEKAPGPSPVADPLVSVRGISKSYPGVTALSSVNIDLRSGEIHGLLGENGAGKSTLIGILSGTKSPTAGTIRVSGSETSFAGPRQAQDLGISTIHQEQSLAPNLTAVENIFLGRELSKGKKGFGRTLDNKAMRSKIEALAKDFGFGAKELDVPVEALGALKQHVVQILKALAFNTRVLILDEPTSGLADHERHTLFEYMRQLRDRGIALLWVTHRLDELFGLADTVTVLRDGQWIATVNPDEETAESLVRLMVGRSSVNPEAGPAQMGRREKRFHGEPAEILRLDAVGRQPLLHDISLRVGRGEILGIAGIAGAGRTETARVILGADRLDAGQIYVKTKAVSIPSPRDAGKKGIAYVPEERKTQAILGDFSVAKNITISDLGKTSIARFFLNRKVETSTAKHYVKDLGIKTSSEQEKIRNLSGGNQQKAVIARCLFTQPDLIIFDEPTQGIDVGAKEEVYRLIYDFADQGGAVIVISSELPELIRVSDRIAIMREGTIVDQIDSTGRDEPASESSELAEYIISQATRGGAAA